MDYYILLFILFIYLLFIEIKNKKLEHFNMNHYLPITDLAHDDHQDIIMNNSDQNKILSERDSNLIPIYTGDALYQPEVSGRHLNFFSHTPKEVPYYPNQIWSSTIQDPYYQPVYSNYFYNDGYFYPLF